MRCDVVVVVEIANYSKWARLVLDKLQIYQAMNIISAYDELSTPAYLACKMGKVCHRQEGKTALFTFRSENKL